MEVDAVRAVSINLDDCLLDVRDQASRYLLWSQLASIAESQAEGLRQHYEVLQAECREKVYEKLSKNNEKATDQRVKDVALRDPSLQSHLKLRRQAELFAQRLKAVQFALQHKKDMLQQISYRQRSEFGYLKDTEYAKPSEPRYSEPSVAEPKVNRDLGLDELKQQAMELLRK